MNAMIAVLDEATRNKIAAGEVVERPSSCVKELVENAIDAGATMIEVEIANGGQTYIRVTDDGCGMSQEDAHMCMIRHATSKIRSVEDIFSITSLGFRGEAIPSIASVSRFQITTRRKEDDFATHLIVNAGKVETEEQVGSSIGTTMEVNDLFFNTPARKKFLKSERTEASKISEMLTKLALAHSDIGFSFINNGRTTLQTGGTGELKETIAAIYGVDVAKEIFPVQYEDEYVMVTGFVGRPSILKSSRNWQTCVVNQRTVHNPMMFKAVDNAYHAMLPKVGYPFAMIHLQMNPATIDVNVHPAKTEIKFSDEKAIYHAIYHSIVQALVAQEAPEQVARPIQANSQQMQHIEEASAQYAHVQQSFFGGEDSLVERSKVESQSQPLILSNMPLEKSAQPIRHTNDYVPLPSSSIPVDERAFSQQLAPKEGVEEVSADSIRFADTEEIFPLGSVAECYVLAKKGNDLYIIDQHAAHERVRYDRFCKRVEGLPSQQLLMPLFVEFDTNDMTILLEQEAVFQDLGYTYSQAGPETIRVEEIPCDLSMSMIQESLQTICHDLQENKHLDKATIRHRALAYLSCRGAIKAGDHITMREMKQLLDDLFKTEKPFVCPHGRPVIIRFTAEELAKLFKRT